MSEKPGAGTVQLLTPSGERIEHPQYSVDLTPQQLLGLYRDMVLARRVDAEASIPAWLADLEEESEQLRRRVRDGVRSMPDPDPGAIFHNIYADGHAVGRRRRAPRSWRTLPRSWSAPPDSSPGGDPDGRRGRSPANRDD